MRGFGGFLAGSLALIVLYTLVQSGTANTADQASSLIITGLKHVLSPDYAAISNRGGSPTTYGSVLPKSSTAPAPAPPGAGEGSAQAGPLITV